MNPAAPCDAPLAFGFLTVVDQPGQGLVGGYLLLNTHARPLEFHCTVPVRPNRAQEILYGATLQPYLYGEQIGPTLVNSSKLRPQLLFTDCPAALAAAPHVDIPLWLVMPTEASPVAEGAGPAAAADATGSASASPPLALLDPPQPLPAGLSVKHCGRNRLGRVSEQRGTAPPVATRHLMPPESERADVLSAEDHLERIAESLDLAEPFERIRAAIQEAQRSPR